MLRGGRFHEIIGLGPRYERLGFYRRKYLGDRKRGWQQATPISGRRLAREGCDEHPSEPRHPQ